MSDDIKNRLPDEDLCAGLRMCADLVQGFPKADAKQMTNPNWLRQAADEIERLRAERFRWERIAHYLYRLVDKYGEICSCDDYEQDWCGIHAYDDEIKGLKERGKA